MEIPHSQSDTNQPSEPAEPSEPAKKHGIKFGLSIAVVIICLVAAGVAVYWIKTEPVSNDYYDNLAKQCKQEKNIITNCCLESVGSMRANGYKQAVNGECPVGFEINQLLCVNGFQWCQPETDEIASWQTYRNEEYGFEFIYPNYWGNATTAEQIFSKEDVGDDPTYSAIDLNKVAEKSIDIGFDGKFCNEKDGCNISLYIQEYDINRPLKLDCYEGICNTVNILEEKQRIESKSNILIGGLKGELVDGIFKPGETFTRVYTAVNPKYEISITAWYNSEGFKFDATKQIDLDAIIKSNLEAPHQSDLKLFLQNLNSVVTTFRFVN